MRARIGMRRTVCLPRRRRHRRTNEEAARKDEDPKGLQTPSCALHFANPLCGSAARRPGLSVRHRTHGSTYQQSIQPADAQPCGGCRVCVVPEPATGDADVSGVAAGTAVGAGATGAAGFDPGAWATASWGAGALTGPCGALFLATSGPDVAAFDGAAAEPAGAGAGWAAGVERRATGTTTGTALAPLGALCSAVFATAEPRGTSPSNAGLGGRCRAAIDARLITCGSSLSFT